MTDSAIDRKSIRRKEKAAAASARQRQEVITSVMTTMAGRQWIWDTLASCKIFHTTFTGDALTAAFEEGRRSAGLALLADIMLACPDQYITAQREANARDITDERRSSQESNGGDPGSDAADGDPDDDPTGLDPTDFNRHNGPFGY